MQNLHLSTSDILIVSLLVMVLAVLWFVFRGLLRRFDALARDGGHQQQLLAQLQQQLAAQQQQAQQLREAMLQAQAELQSRLEQRLGDVQHSMEKRLGEMTQASIERQARAGEDMLKNLQQQLQEMQKIRSGFEQRFGDIQHSLEKRLGEMARQSMDSFTRASKALNEQMQQRLQEISGQVEQRLDKGFEKTTKTFTDVMKTLARIDAAQQRIDELSSNVVSLQEVLSDKRSRGAFGEVQMAGLISNMMPEGSYALQHSLNNGKRVDCMMFLPEPTGHIAIDSKFPLDAYQKMMDDEADAGERKAAERQFKQDIKKHIGDIADKYIIEGETADGAIMFIPAEAVFAEIHAHHPDLVELANRSRVWMVSPTTLMAILTTARAVLKDSATRKQVHVIKEHLGVLAKDFERFRKRMDNLSKHIRQANEDVNQVHITAGKISGRFEKIERVELKDEDIELLEAAEELPEELTGDDADSRDGLPADSRVDEPAGQPSDTAAPEAPA